MDSNRLGTKEEKGGSDGYATNVFKLQLFAFDVGRTKRLFL